mmetsp:Transcript_529/g.1955  ORF Transcript_529/g.1955 Transcript_529/m.1955 type:complete len:87 (+) Transcript_529:81-341(+)
MTNQVKKFAPHTEISCAQIWCVTNLGPTNHSHTTLAQLFSTFAQKEKSISVNFIIECRPHLLRPVERCQSCGSKTILHHHIIVIST